MNINEMIQRNISYFFAELITSINPKASFSQHNSSLATTKAELPFPFIAIWRIAKAMFCGFKLLISAPILYWVKILRTSGKSEHYRNNSSNTFVVNKTKSDISFSVNQQKPLHSIHIRLIYFEYMIWLICLVAYSVNFGENSFWALFTKTKW